MRGRLLRWAAAPSCAAWRPKRALQRSSAAATLRVTTGLAPSAPRRMRARVVFGTAAARASARRLIPRALRSRSTRRVAAVRGGGMVRHYGAATEREQARRTARTMVVGQFWGVTGLRGGGLGPACCSGCSSLLYRLCDPFENRELKESHRTQGFAPCLPNPTTP